MNTSFQQEGQAYQYKTTTITQSLKNENTSNNAEFQDAVQRYELRRSSKPRQQQQQQGTVITTQYVTVNEGRSGQQDLESSRMSQRIVDKYQHNASSHYEVNRQSVKEVMDKYKRGRGTTTSQITTTEIKQYAAVPQYEQQKETVFDNRNSHFIEEQQEHKQQITYNTYTTKQQAYEEDYEQIKEDCQMSDTYKRPEREEEEEVDLIESDYVSCQIF